MPRAFDIRRIEVIDDRVADMYRRMGSVKRLEAGFQSHGFARDFLRAVVQQRHPEWDSAALEAEVCRRLLGAAA